MELTEDESNKNYGKKFLHCMRTTLLPYEYGDTCFSCGYNVVKQKTELTNIQSKSIQLLNFINSLNYAEKKII